MCSFFQSINPLSKIIFIFSQLIFLYATNNPNLTISVIIIFLLLNFSSYSRVKSSLKNLLNISPLLLSFFLLGFIFGNPLTKDLKLTMHISLITIYTFWFIETTSSYNFLSSLRSFFPSKDSATIIFCYNLIYFFPNLQNTIKNTISIYKYKIGSLKNLKRRAHLFIIILEKAVNKARNHHRTAIILDSKLKPNRLSGFDFLPIILIIGQLAIILL